MAKYWVNLPEKKKPLTRDEIVQYIKSQVLKGHTYFKAKYIAKDLNDRPKRIGQILRELSNKQVSGIKVKKWSKSLSTTWHIVMV